MKQHAAGVNYRTQAGISQGTYLGGNIFYNLINGGARVAGNDRKALAFESLSNEVHNQGVGISFLKLLNLLVRENPVHTGKMTKLAVFHISDILLCTGSILKLL